MAKAAPVTKSLKFQSAKDEMPLRGPAIARPQLPPRGTSKRVSRSMRGRR